jgi:hypothetical protein
MEGLEVQVMETRKRVLGEEHPFTLITMNILAWTLMSECHRLLKQKLGVDHSNITSSFETLKEWETASFDVVLH